MRKIAIWWNLIFMSWSGYWFSVKYWTDINDAIIQLICFFIFAMCFIVEIHTYEKNLKFKKFLEKEIMP